MAISHRALLCAAALLLCIGVKGQAPAMAPAAGLTTDCSTPLTWLASNGSFTGLVELVDAAGLGASLDDPLAQLTIFAPTDAALNARLIDLTISLNDLLAEPTLVIEFVEYHVLPQTLKTFVDGAIYQTLYASEKLLISKVGADTTVVGARTQAAVLDTAGYKTCQSVIYPISDLLIPAVLGK